MIGRVVGAFSFVFSVCMYVCLGVRRGLGRVLIKYSGNVRLQKVISNNQLSMFVL